MALHRRLLADHLVLVEQIRVEHLFPDGRLIEHAPTSEARQVDDHVVYDVAAQGSLLATYDETTRAQTSGLDLRRVEHPH